MNTTTAPRGDARPRASGRDRVSRDEGTGAELDIEERAHGEPHRARPDVSVAMLPPPASVSEPKMIARGRRVMLRTLTRADLPYLSRWADSPFVDAMVGSDLLYQYKHIYHRRNDVFLELLVRDWTQLNAVIVPVGGSGEPVGFVRLFGINLVHGYGFVETIVADPRHARKGWGVEATRLLLAYAMDTIGIRRVEAKVYAYNRLSINALTRNGFTQEGVLREACFHDGKYWDILVFGILKDAMEAERKKDEMTIYHPDGARR